MKHLSLFSGMGGFDYAAEQMGWENVAHCEWNDFCRKILKYYWPNAISYEDIRTTDFTIHRGRIDILTGGFPCQPFSVAGKQKGTEDERYLWPEMLRAIREIQPSWVVGENVRGLINWSKGMVFEQVQIDLETIGYEVLPVLLPAASVNAPHRRDRIWFIAYSKSYRDRRKLHRLEGTDVTIGKSKKHWKNNSEFRHNGGKRSFTNGDRIRCNNRSDNWEKRHICQDFNRFIKKNKPKRYGRKHRFSKIGRIPTNTNVFGFRIETNWFGKSGLVNQASATNDWENFPTQSPICDGNDGISTELDGITFRKWREESIKAGGNSIVPQVAIQIFKAIEEFNNQF